MRIRDLVSTAAPSPAREQLSLASPPSNLTAYGGPSLFRELLDRRAPGEEASDDEAPGFLEPLPLADRTFDSPLRASAARAPNSAAELPIDSIVRAIAVAVDQHHRRIVLLRIEVRGATLRVRVSRSERGAKISLRTDDANLRRRLRENVGELETRCAERAIALDRIDITQT